MPRIPADISIQTNIDLQSKNTLNLPCRAAYYATFSNLEELVRLHEWALENQLPLRVLGGGSNVLMQEKLDALVVQSVDDTVSLIEPVESDNDRCDQVYVDVAAGKNWHNWVIESTQYGHGIENLALIPGTVGAAPIQNIGAYGVELCDHIDSVLGYQLSRKQLVRLSAKDCQFGYRDSTFKRGLKQDFVVLSVRFVLNKSFQPNLNYAPLNELQKRFDSGQLSPQDLIEAVIQVRQSKLPDPSVTPNAGSYFKNPQVPFAEAERLHSTWPTMPQYPQEQGVKLAAAWLIDQSGFKGRQVGKVKMHDKQALVMTSSEGATLDSVLNLQAQIQQEVRERFGVELEPEPQIFT